MTRKRKFLIVSHGAMSGGLRSALELIVGAVEGVYVVQAYVEENVSIEEEVAAILSGDVEMGARGEWEAEWVVFTDLLGGSVTNQVLRAAMGKRVHIVAGVNLPLVIEVVLADSAAPIAEVISEAVERAREQLVYVNAILSSSKDN